MKKVFLLQKLYGVFFKLALSVLLILIVAVVPTFIFSYGNIIESKYQPQQSEYQGIVELWNIDNFEGGISSKTSFLKTSALAYEKENKGFFVMVKNMTIEECLLALSQNQMPAMFSFSGGLVNHFENLLDSFENNFQISQNILKSGQKNGLQLAVGWCFGAYVLISTKQKVPMLEYDSLCNLSLSSGTIGTSKKGKQKITYSLVFGAKNTNPLLAYEKSFGQIVPSKTAFDENCYQKTAYQSYCDFVENKANILLGTQRDLARIENRISQGKIADVVYEFLGNATDLVQYVSIAKNLSEQAKSECEKFVQYLVSKKNQKNLASTGMFSVIGGESIYETGVFHDFEKSLSSELEIQKIFS